MGRNSLTLRVVLRYTLIIGVAGLLTFYAFWQARLLLTGPVIEFTDTLRVAQSERSVTLEGRAENITRITLNGRDIYTDKNGYFKEVLVLENGYTVATIVGTDRYGRSAFVSRPFMYTPAR